MGPTQRTVAGWILEERLGSGGFGEVWRARRRHVDLFRALKLTPIAGERAFSSWRHEIGRLEALSHPNIVRFYDADIVADGGPFQDYAWIATELCEHSLADELQSRNGHHLLSSECEDLIDQMLAALTAAHEDACVHRDIKPANILRHASGAWKLCDFGTARLIPQGESHPQTTVIGTFPYMSASAHRGRQDLAADLYALGVTLHEALCGKRLHPRAEGMTDSEYVKLILDTPPVIAPELPERWQRVLQGLIGADGVALSARDLHDWFRHTRGHAPLPPAAAQATAVADERGPDEATGPTAHLPGAEGYGQPTQALQSTVFQPEPEPPSSPQHQQVFVPAPPPSPPPAPARPEHMPAQAPRQAPPPPQADRWEPTNVLGRRILAFCIDAVVVYLVTALVWTVAYGGLLTVAYDRVSSEEVGPDATAFCRSLRLTDGSDCREFRGVAGLGGPFDGNVYVRSDALWSGSQIGTVIAVLVILYIGVLRQGGRGTTPGKRLTGIRTTGPNGQPPGQGRALVRTVLLPVDMFVWPLLLAAAHTDSSDDKVLPARRRLGDRVTNTWVLRKGARH